MTKRDWVFYGAVLHDIGKIIEPESDSYKLAGYKFLKELNIYSDEVLNCVKGDIKDSCDGQASDIANIVSVADHLSTGINNLKSNGTQETRFFGLQSLFNQLNKNSDDKVIAPMLLDGYINFPQEKKAKLNNDIYREIQIKLKKHLKKSISTQSGHNSLLALLESLWSFIPSSIPDISFYDHAKTTAAFASCIFEYFEENKITDYKLALSNENKFFNEQAFVLASFDLSGIQSFIYKTEIQHALRRLRSKSIYLGLLSEHLANTIIERIGLTRANILYIGGGRCNMLLPNTHVAKNIFTQTLKDANTWLLNTFEIDLFIGSGYAECTGNELQNKDINGEIMKDSFEKIRKHLEIMINQSKQNRFTPKLLYTLNNKEPEDNERECSSCGARRKLLTMADGKTRCSFCRDFADMSTQLLKDDVCFIISDKDKNEPRFEFPFTAEKSCYLHVIERQEILSRMSKGEHFNRIYVKNYFDIEENPGINVLMGDYASCSKTGRQLSISELAQMGDGIDRIAVVRADVDRLGATFANGYSAQYHTLSRTAALSRNLSIFFQYYINIILSEKRYQINTIWTQTYPKKVTIIYSGGDDLFAVGALADVLDFICDLTDAFKRYTQNTLTLSAGLSVFPDKYPMLKIADLTDDLEKAAKRNKTNQNESADSLCLFEEEYVFKWDDFKNNVLGEQLALLKRYFTGDSDGLCSTFLYRIMQNLRKSDNDQSILPRIAYDLARLKERVESDKVNSNEDDYRKFTELVLSCANKDNIKMRRELLTAIQIFLYLKRNIEEE